ncbi:hypothetical protein L3X38_030889 [Prunus dulcis]|uniref:RNase H type-1 domain-containing protein n=1 Tax=Prunus dulcis TaxID=3755 RepID=A0AAD4YTH5_PRUDU|nr:hypothetical protein L3X38_030889 [Prunus dulcis]
MLAGKSLLTPSQLVPLLEVFGVVPTWPLRFLLQILTFSPGWIWETRNNLIFKDINPHPVGVLTMVGQNIGDNTISVAECIALRDGLAYGTHRGWRKVLVGGDSKHIINCVNQKALTLWSINLLIKDIVLISSFCDSWSVSHVFREANFTADAIASLGHGLNPSKLWEAGLPLNCSITLLHESIH